MTRSRLSSWTLAALACVLLGACADGRKAPSAASGVPAGNVDRLVEWADEARKAGAIADAQAHYRLALDHEPDHPGALLGLGEARLAKGELRAAEHLFSGLVEREAIPPLLLARAHQGLGLVHLRRRDVDAAEPPLSQAVKIDPNLWRAWNALGLVHDSRQEWHSARRSYERALEARPDSAVVLNNLGYSLMLRKRYDEAVEVLTRALRRDPKNERTRANLRLALAWQGRYDEAALGATGKAEPQVLNDIGYVALMRGDLAAAEGLFVRAIEASPSHYTPAALNLQHVRALRDGEQPGEASAEKIAASGPPLSLLETTSDDGDAE